MKTTSKTSLGLGVGLRPVHYHEILNTTDTTVEWFEAVTENYMGLEDRPGGGRPLYYLEKICERYPIALHGVSLNIGSMDPLNKTYLMRLRDLIERFQPGIVSDHLCWNGVEGKNVHDLLPLPFTQDTVDHVVRRVVEVQDFIGRQLLLENVSSYFSYCFSEMTEWEFISEVAKRSGCGILLDINNVFVSASNSSYNPNLYLENIPRDHVKQFHLAGHSSGELLLIDTHDAPVTPDVWDLFQRAVKLFGSVPTLLEWDDKIPRFADLSVEVAKAKRVFEGVLQ